MNLLCERCLAHWLIELDPYWCFDLICLSMTWLVSCQLFFLMIVVFFPIISTVRRSLIVSSSHKCGKDNQTGEWHNWSLKDSSGKWMMASTIGLFLFSFLWRQVLTTWHSPFAQFLFRLLFYEFLGLVLVFWHFFNTLGFSGISQTPYCLLK